MSAFALYRFPHDSVATFMIQRSGNPAETARLRDLPDETGFLFAPFLASAEEPYLFISPDECFTIACKTMADKAWWAKDLVPHLRESRIGPMPDGGRNAYGRAFQELHGALLDGQLEKVVLSRCCHVGGHRRAPYELFQEACRRYPRLFVALVSAERCGTWLLASPELLLENEAQADNRWHTMALAGTMKLEGKQLAFDNPDRSSVQDIRWSQKNIQEQRIVASYITEKIRPLSHTVDETGPYTRRAGNLVHLCSDFHFTTDGPNATNVLAGMLHPTPAVCGLPRQAAQDAILKHEPAPRHYYSGFCGPQNVHRQTRLFVSLRCMEICTTGYDLYAGGGLLRDSIEQLEWLETEAKLDTMRELLAEQDHADTRNAPPKPSNAHV